MSLFTDFTQTELIANPKQTGSYHRALKDKQKNEEVKSRKELRQEMRAKLSPEEYKKWRQVEHYKMKKEELAEKYKQKKKEEQAYIEEIYKEIYDEIPDPPNYNKIFAEKFDRDDKDSGGKYRYYWRNSRINYIKPSKLPKYTKPIRIYPRRNFGRMITELGKMQDRAYEYIRPHIGELNIRDFKLSRNQFFTKAPMRVSNLRMRKLMDDTDISNNQICSVASALLRGKYIINELYLGRCSFLVGDIIITQNGNVIRPILENNIPWLTKDTVEELHQKRLDYLKKKTDDLEIYALWDCYLLAVQPNERETYFYITPT